MIVPSDSMQPLTYLRKGGVAFMQGGHHLHTCTVSYPGRFPNGEGSHISQHSVII